MRVKLLAITSLVASGVIVTAFFVQSLSSSSAQTQTRPRYLPEYTASGDLILPKNFHEWAYAGSPLTPNALNDGHAGFPEYHNVYIEPGSYEIYKRTNEFPEGTILFKELQLTLPGQNPDGSRTEPKQTNSQRYRHRGGYSEGASHPPDEKDEGAYVYRALPDGGHPQYETAAAIEFLSRRTASSSGASVPRALIIRANCHLPCQLHRCSSSLGYSSGRRMRQQKIRGLAPRCS